MIKEKFWQRTIAIAVILHLIQGFVMLFSNTATNPFFNAGMFTIIVAFIIRFFNASKAEFSDQEK